MGRLQVCLLVPHLTKALPFDERVQVLCGLRDLEPLGQPNGRVLASDGDLRLEAQRVQAHRRSDTCVE